MVNPTAMAAGDYPERELCAISLNFKKNVIISLRESCKKVTNKRYDMYGQAGRYILNSPVIQ